MYMIKHLAVVKGKIERRARAPGHGLEILFGHRENPINENLGNHTEKGGMAKPLPYVLVTTLDLIRFSRYGCLPQILVDR